MSKGIVLVAFGEPCYSYAAWNLALSIKHHNPDLPILLLHDEKCFSKGNFDLSVFDHRKLITPDYTNPALTKASIYEHLPFDYNLFLDVDALCFKNAEPLFERLIASEAPYAVHVLDTYSLDENDKMANMFWADKSVIWEHYNLSKEAKLPATQSSVQFIKKCEESKKIFEQLNSNLCNPIPLNKLRNQWGGSQPDELYLNIALAQLGVNPPIGDDVLFFANKMDKRTLSVIQDSYYFMSIYGGKAFTRPAYKDFYDRLMIKYCYARKVNHRFKISFVLDNKHSDKPQKKFVPKKTNHLTYEKLVDKIQSGEPFAYSRWGDGEFMVYFGLEFENCDKVWFNKEMRDCLKKSLAQAGHTVAKEGWTMQYNHESIKKQAEELSKDWTDSKFVEHSTNNTLWKLTRALRLKNALHVSTLDIFPSVNSENAWENRHKILEQILRYNNQVFVFSSSITSNWLIAEAWERNKTNTYIDAGSVFDPYCGKQTRGYHKRNKFYRNQVEPVYFHIATHKKREKLFKRALQGITNMNRKADKIFVCCNNYNPSWAEGVEKIIPEKDMGAEGRFTKCHLPGYHLFFDDDIAYPADYADKMLKAIDDYNKEAAIFIHGKVFKSLPVESYTEINPNRVVHHFQSPLKENTELTVGGTGTMGFHSSLVEDLSLGEHFKERNMSDPQISKYFHDRGIKMIALSRPNLYLKELSGGHEGSIWEGCLKDDSKQTEIINSMQAVEV